MINRYLISISIALYLMGMSWIYIYGYYNFKGVTRQFSYPPSIKPQFLDHFAGEPWGFPYGNSTDAPSMNQLYITIEKTILILPINYS